MMKLLKLSLLLFVLTGCLSLNAQNAKSAKSTHKKYPASFSISKMDLEKIASYKAGETVLIKKNKYLNKSDMILNTQNGDTKFMRIKLNYFANSYLTVQVNGIYSTQIFVLSDDKSIFYKSKVEGEGFVMRKCEEDEIISE